MRLTKNTVLITGGSSGIGFELVKQLSAQDNVIIVTGRDAGKLAKVQSQFPKVITLQSDASNVTEIKQLAQKVLKEYPDLNVLINNAGIMRELNLHDTNGDWTQEIETNLKGPIQMVQAFLPHLKSKPTAAIVNVSSGLAFVPLPSSPVYCATKAALHSFTESLRVQMSRTNLKIFELAPPATQTELLGTMSAEDMKGITVMPVKEMVAFALKAMAADQWEIRPGQSNQLKFMSRIAPQFILKQMSRPVERMLNANKH